MPPRPGRGEGISLLDHDGVKNAADEHDLETLNLAGAIDILWQIRGSNYQKPENVRCWAVMYSMHARFVSPAKAIAICKSL
jgi:hypothetical protein